MRAGRILRVIVAAVLVAQVTCEEAGDEPRPGNGIAAQVWLERAATAGNETAQLDLARLHAEGSATWPRRPHLAYQWYCVVAHRSGETDLDGTLAALGSELSTAERVHAASGAADWLRRNGIEPSRACAAPARWVSGDGARSEVEVSVERDEATETITAKVATGDALTLRIPRDWSAAGYLYSRAEDLAAVRTDDTPPHDELAFTVNDTLPADGVVLQAGHRPWGATGAQLRLYRLELDETPSYEELLSSFRSAAERWLPRSVAAHLPGRTVVGEPGPPECVEASYSAWREDFVDPCTIRVCLFRAPTMTWALALFEDHGGRGRTDGILASVRPHAP